MKAAYGLLGLSLVVEFDKGKPSEPATFPICWKINIRWGADGREVFSELGFGHLIRKIPNKQSNRHYSSPIDHLLALAISMRETFKLDSSLRPCYAPTLGVYVP
jgi:hypothetical protein